MTQVQLHPQFLERMARAVEKVKDRLERTVTALENAQIPYAIIGGNAVAAWVASVDEEAVRNTADVDILLRREDLDLAEKAMAEAGFLRYQLMGVEMFLDGPDANPRSAVHVLIAGEKIRPEYILPAPEVTESNIQQGKRVLSLEALVRMKLTSFRDKDRTHLRDFLEVGLIDASWISRYPRELADRLQNLVDTPNG